MGKANSLSRQPDWQKGVEKDNENRTLLKKKWLEVRAMQVAEIIIDRVDLLEKIRELKAKDDKIIKAVEEMKQARVPRGQKHIHKHLLSQAPGSKLVPLPNA